MSLNTMPLSAGRVYDLLRRGWDTQAAGGLTASWMVHGRPGVGKSQVVQQLAQDIQSHLRIQMPEWRKHFPGVEEMTVAVMGCVVNGPGEAREADLGVASGNGKGQIFVKGEVIKTVPESKIVETLIEEAMRLAEDMPDVEAADGPTVSVG